MYVYTYIYIYMCIYNKFVYMYQHKHDNITPARIWSSAWMTDPAMVTTSVTGHPLMVTATY